MTRSTPPAFPFGTITLTLGGGAGDDMLFGGQGSETLLGGVGNDVLNGGIGTDFMKGGAGDDAYVVPVAGTTMKHFSVSRILAAIRDLRTG